MEYLRRASQHISDQGRGPDDALMHVTHAELQALGRLHPSGELPRNPRTGLPEAGFLESILPAIVGIGATLATGGAALPFMGMSLSPTLVGAAASGLTSTAMTGDLGKGVMSGLMSYGMGSALEGLGGGLPGADAATQATTEGTKTLAATPAQLASAAAQGPGSNVVGGQLASNVASNAGVGASPFLSQAAAPASQAISRGVADATGMGAPGLLSGFDAAASNLGPEGPGVGNVLKNTFIDNARSTTLPLLVGAAGSMGQEPAEIPKEPGRRELQRRYPEQFPIARQVVAPPSDYRPGIDPEFDYFEPMASGGGVHGYYARGGIADANPQSSMRANIEAEAKMALLDHHPKAKEALRRYANTFGEDALRALTDKVSSMGGRIRGAGGGLDDLIPGTIEGRKEVRLADGEFVVPADVVSHLGDGSSDHGVRKLTEMMDRIRTVKTGTTKQAGHIKDKKVMPA